MSFQVDTAFVQQYTTNVSLLLQQRGSKLREACTMGSYTGKAAKAVEQVGPVTAIRKAGRHTDTPLISTPHDARWVFPTDFEWADMIDDQDKLRMLIDPTSPYAQNGAYALGRALDDLIIEAALGTAKTGENGTTNTVFDTANQRIAVGATGLTIAKLRQAKRILAQNEVDMANDPLYIAVTATQIDNLLGTTEVTSSDYNTVKALVQGQIDTFMGFKFIQIERLGVDGSGDRRCFAWAKSGLHVGMWNDITTRISERADKSYATQVYVKGSFGATRTEEKKVVEIICDL
ncbi:hypothetical protein UFOVP669_6 [uncultured Caudovirales phage]|uniref:Uncharacterized protein n=1 Tax=uncultured Caudovirales phage TaxID=2100421 RepID=A0A6J5N9J2_9CAUD|nr:hypothetical protein UFOVP400_54 [uncultured Caudovirales phage]CAB4155407.1 hypothetical protein UFOVP669_6 [uncultured Caudovirales phage]CAB4213378.1 hypothetical protein UFOVP1449_9 [uncultured Caudovirales phage]